jgi:hypothetical protein
MPIIRTEPRGINEPDLRNLAPDSRRLGVLFLLLSIHLVKFTTTGAKVHLVQPDPLGLLEEFPEYKEPDKDWQRDAAGRGSARATVA